jgi:hypothetical protein
MGFDTLPPIFQPSDAAPGTQPPKLYFQETDPVSIEGFKPDQAVMNTKTGDVFQLVGQAGAYGWLKVTNMRGPAGVSGDGALDPAELEAVTAAVAAELDPPIDLVVLFENGLL